MEKKLGLFSAIATSVGLVVATSCLMSLGQGTSVLGTGFIITMVLACIINMLTALSLSELNSLMPNLTGGLAQYTLAGMGPFITILILLSVREWPRLIFCLLSLPKRIRKGPFT